MRLASVYQTDHEEPIYLEYTLIDETGEPMIPEDVARTLSGHEAPDVSSRESEPLDSVVVPAGSSEAYGWIEDEIKS